ncbi:MAG TPA: penicillin-binding transpeptidase domain-containing protein [Polyangiaceae bacterium]|nr:penicillin-binding transpeptidase domain-containing protein [Polyangiaceae bacterium]
MSKAWFNKMLCALVVTGCATPPATRPTSLPAAAQAQPAFASTPSQVPAKSIHERPEWREHFRAERVSGTIAIFDSADGSTSCSDAALCSRATIPASTFKIPNSMIALENGILEHADSVMRWDGKPYPIEDWNHDQTLRSAIRVSCVPCFQAVARQIGDAKMKEWLTKLDYGNRDTSGGVDRFWLTGGLRISPLQQIDFLRRFEQGQLPISKRTAETVRDIITLDVGENHVLLGKTGLIQPPEFPEIAGWFVGWLELSERRVFFATLLQGHENGVDFKGARRRLTERVLRALQLLPAGAARG